MSVVQTVGRRSYIRKRWFDSSLTLLEESPSKTTTRAKGPIGLGERPTVTPL